MCRLTCLILVTALLLAGSQAIAQAPDPAFGPFVPFGKLQASLDGTVLEGAEMFYAERPGAYVLRAPGLTQPLLINVRNQRVERLRAAAIRNHDNGTVSLLTGAVIASAGPFQVDQSQLAATLDDGHRLTLGPKPDLLGPQSAEALEAYNAAYGYRAGLYPPSTAAVTRLRQETRPVKVSVYFGSWCPTCARIVPWLLAVDKALEGGSISFEYYGLPHTMDDPAAKEAGVTAVPTAVVTVDGKELGRRTAGGLGIPEQALLEILAGE